MEIKAGMRLKEGSLCNVPLKIGNLGTQPFSIRAMRYAVPGHNAAKALKANMRLAPGDKHEILDVAFTLDRAGEYALKIECEIDWDCGKRVGLSFAADAVATASSRDAFINSQGGTGNMIYISGEASSRIVEQQLEHASSSVGYRHLAARPMQPEELDELGEKNAVVTLATKLVVPDFYQLSKGAEGKPLQLWADPREGILLGRDRPGPNSRNHAVLRFPAQIKDCVELNQQLSGTHWRIFPREGRWWLEVLGRVPALVASREVTPGQSVQLAENQLICPLSTRPSALRLRLVHIERQQGAIQASRIEIV
ncbi:MAG: hypothetical protein IT461_17045 [Planctomycetes bacterium]|nr:hypothetical protein [Planctomycetota bacterium]